MGLEWEPLRGLGSTGKSVKGAGAAGGERWCAGIAICSFRVSSSMDCHGSLRHGGTARTGAVDYYSLTRNEQLVSLQE